LKLAEILLRRESVDGQRRAFRPNVALQALQERAFWRRCPGLLIRYFDAKC
jgi:hypothetical protein